MSFTIEPINRQILSCMQEPLSCSAGYNVNLKDELEYFDAQTSLKDSGATSSLCGWLVARSLQNEILGFIRVFPQGEWSLAELHVASEYAERANLASSLIKSFAETTAFSSGHRLRIDVMANDQVLNAVLADHGFSHKTQTFLMFQLNLDALMPASASFPSLNIEMSVHPPATSTANPSEVAEVLSFLNPVSPSEAKDWIGNGSIRTIRHNNRIVAAAQVFFSEHLVEINRIATHENYLRRGHGENLIGQIRSEAQAKGIKTIYLQVEDIRIPAIRLYKKCSFVEMSERKQLWHSRWY